MTGQMPLRQNLATEYAAYFTANPQYKPVDGADASAEAVLG
jgi:hypothetical protein